MADIIDFERNKEVHQYKRKEARADALKRAFRLARGEAEDSRPVRRRKQRKSPKK